MNYQVKSKQTWKAVSSCSITANGSGLCVVALSINLKLNTTLDMAIMQNPCYVPFLFKLQ